MYIIAYDVTDNKERKKVTTLLSNFAERVQKSVWTADLDARECRKLLFLLDGLHIESGFIDVWNTGNRHERIGCVPETSRYQWAMNL